MKRTDLERYVQKMADEAENENNYGLVCTYERIANALTEWVSPKLALKIMRQIGSLTEY